MMELVDDPLVLEAALALVDEWCVATKQHDERRGNCSPMASTGFASVSPPGLRKRAREELTWLQASVHHLRERVGSKPQSYPLPRVLPMSSSDGSAESDDDSGTEQVAVEAEQRVKARRLLQAVQAYNRVFATSGLSFGYSISHSIRPVDDERILATLHSRLDALAQIAQANRTTWRARAVVDTSPTLTGTGFRAQARASYVLPFKLSHVTDVMWEMAVQALKDGQRSAVTPDEQFSVMESRYETPWGVIASTDLLACRQICQDDGSVIHLLTKVGSGTRDVKNEGNLLAGCVVKQAGWTRIQRAPDHSGGRASRSLVSVEIAQSIVVEVLPGYTMSRERLLRFWDAMMDPSSQREGSRTELESRLMDRQLATPPRVFQPSTRKRIVRTCYGI